jgi:hypothetical protein
MELADRNQTEFNMQSHKFLVIGVKVKNKYKGSDTIVFFILHTHTQALEAAFCLLKCITREETTGKT